MLFSKLSSSFHYVFLSFYLSFIKLSNYFRTLCCKTISKRFPESGDEVDCVEQNVECIHNEEWESADDGSQSEIHEENLGFITFECSRNGDLVSDTIPGKEALLLSRPKEGIHLDQSFFEEPPGNIAKNIFSHQSTGKESIQITDLGTILVDRDNAQLEDTDEHDRDEHSAIDTIDSCEEWNTDVKTNKLNVVKNFLDDDGNFFGFTPPKLEGRCLRPIQSHTEEDFEDSFTVGSTSKCSSEPRSSIQHRGSMNEDPFSSSSRRSCPTWESFSAFQKYDEEEIFCDQISAQNLNDTKLQKGVGILPRSMSQKIVQKITKRERKPEEFGRSPDGDTFSELHKGAGVLPRSMSQKIVQKLTKRNKRPREFRRSPYHDLVTAYVAGRSPYRDTISGLHKEADVLPRSMSQKIVQKLTKRNRKPTEFQRSPYHELETAYVAEVCSAWETLNLNYKTFLQLRTLEGEEDPGYPAYVAQQFQQFQVLLQRFIENEPYEHGRRPEIYYRIKISSPKLLQVPEFKGIEKTEYNHQDGWYANISSVKFMAIMEDGIQTFMDFLKRDKEKHFQIFKAFVGRNNRTSLADPTLLHMLKKANEKKKKKIKDMCRVRKCLRKPIPKPKDEEMEILMGLVDLKVVSRVLKLSEISEQQLQWCEAKMSKVRFWEGKLQRDSSPLSFPVHPVPRE